MLVGSEAYAEAASAVPDIVTRVVIDPVGDGERHTVEEHITREILVRFARHYHYSVVRRLPVGENDNVPVAVVEVDVVVAVAKKVCGTEFTLGSASNDINLQYGNWNIVIMPNWQTEDDRVMIMSKEANKNLCGNMFFNRIPLTITNWVDNHTGNYIWNGRCRFGVGFGSYKHILLAVDSAGSVPNATKL